MFADIRRILVALSVFETMRLDVRAVEPAKGRPIKSAHGTGRVALGSRKICPYSVVGISSLFWTVAFGVHF